MVKVTSLLEKMGLVYGRQERPEVSAAGEEPAMGPPAVRDAGAGAPPQAAPPEPDVKLDESALGQAPASDDWTLEQIYASAGVQPPAHGFTVYRLIEMLEGEEFRDLDGPTRARVIAGVLKRLPAGAVEVEDIVRDAAARDRALDAFERFLSERVVRLERETAEKNAALQQQIDELTIANTQLMEANRAAVAQERARLDRWRARKREEEERLFAAVAPFVERNPVTRDEPPGPGSPK
ncbi:MAG TPA: hypothetical protein P5234_15625 [Thermoanaerobaculaceae bacterium]|nr:hypothetical protein [Thermoanaerobaculaceae bacterium]HRS17665.1 hypothetical protein [Thermoanaerobaculaceae bacterium]